MKPPLAIVGNAGGTNIGESFKRAAIASGREVIFFSSSEAMRGFRALRSLSWRFAGRRPLRLNRLSADVVAACREARPDVLIATGTAPLTAAALGALRGMGIICVNYSTDDPWNPALRTGWHLRALPEYDLVFTTRRKNIVDFERLGCPEVRYLPFGYDEWLFRLPERPLDALPYDVLFAGGADRDRVAFMTEFMRSGPPIALVGGYWERFRATRPYALGQQSPEQLCALTAAAKINLCLVRRANRDGHVMRSFEIAALGGCMLAEDTEEHREIFGDDGECVVYFRTPAEAAERAHTLLTNAEERERLACVIRARVVEGAHTYRDRITMMLRTTACRRRKKRSS
jgi:spore maturation protein CgeB